MPRPTKQHALSPDFTADASPHQRLPVNPRRKKVAPDQRKRVATACNRCNVKRIKCSGENPCRQCNTAGKECLYPEPVEKITIPRNELDALQLRCDSLEQLLRENNIAPPLEPRPQMHPVSPMAFPGPGSPSYSSPAFDAFEIQPQEGGRYLQDPDGNQHYLGETSGTTFLDKLKEFMSTIQGLASRQGTSLGTVGVGSYQSWDSRPLQLPSSVNPSTLPPLEDMTRMLTDVSNFIQDGNGNYPSGGIFFWPFSDVASTLGVAPPGARSSPGQLPHAQIQTQGRRETALYHVAFAFASLLRPPDANSELGGPQGEVYFARAKTLLGNPLDTTFTKNDIPVLALMALYWIENNRRDAAYKAISTAIDVSKMIGIHRGQFVDEPIRRSFWTVYTLDRWLSCLMGLPPKIPKSAVTLLEPQEYPDLPNPSGLREHVKLADISNYIVYNSYRTGYEEEEDSPREPPNMDDMELDDDSDMEYDMDPKSKKLRKAMRMLHRWKKTLPRNLKDNDEDNDRARCTLHMHYNQLVIITIRPAFLTAIKKVVAGGILSEVGNERPVIEEHPHVDRFRECVESARRNIDLAGLIRSGKTINSETSLWTTSDQTTENKKLLMPDLHHIFNAAIILMMHQIGFLNLRTSDVLYIEYATNIFKSEADMGSGYGKDCHKVLLDLKELVWALRRRTFENVEGEQQWSNQRTAPHLPQEKEIESWRNEGDWELYQEYLV
ncbi:hypothetical protein B0T17DRAFT_489175 [Bombardia bombarda]|uniref:Zn(2)-C6 fungal-type domain-containing protein n=1 Tax=Bombardia bombarda TaxID=252184 RepID=A0AA40C9J9_9PEZI|nr:hypothetical protein B0T17DRAFT_489175 [Bombardia bombarda]